MTKQILTSKDWLATIFDGGSFIAKINYKSKKLEVVIEQTEIVLYFDCNCGEYTPLVADFKHEVYDDGDEVTSEYSLSEPLVKQPQRELDIALENEWSEWANEQIEEYKESRENERWEFSNE